MRASLLMPRTLTSDPQSAQILALLESLSAELLANKSATAVLEKWCADHRIADVPTVIARRIEGPVLEPTEQIRARLKVDDETALEFRNVALMCGDIVLSLAQNWYVPERLTPAMNAVLTTSETPFGKVIAPLSPTRQTVSVSLLWSALPGLKLPENLLEHRAILSTHEGLPIAEVIETYQRGVMSFLNRR